MQPILENHQHGEKFLMPKLLEKISHSSYMDIVKEYDTRSNIFRVDPNEYGEIKLCRLVQLLIKGEQIKSKC